MGITLNGVTYNDADFAGKGYIPLFPEKVFTDMLAEIGVQVASVSLLQSTSTTSNAVNTQQKTFVLAADVPFVPGLNIIAIDKGAPTVNWITGRVVNYTPGTKTVIFNVTTAKGSGTKSNWDIASIGERGEDGDVSSALPRAGGTMTGAINMGGNQITNLQSGTWAPQISFDGGTTGLVQGTASGVYTKISDMVFIQAHVIIDVKGSSTGLIRMSLPITASQQDPSGIMPVEYNNGSNLSTAVIATAVSGTGYMWFKRFEGGNALLLSNLDVDSSFLFRLTGWYKV